MLKDWIINNWKKCLPWLFVIFLIFCLSWSVRSCQDKNSRYNNNIRALTDSITYYQSQMGALVASKTAFESNIEELKLVNSKLYQELEDMKLKKGKVDNAVHVEGNIEFEPSDTVYLVQYDTIYDEIENTIIVDKSSFNQKFDFSYQWRVLLGSVNLKNDSLNVRIDKDKIYFDYTVAMDNDNRIYIKSNNPYVQYTELSGFTVPKYRKKHFAIGPSVGVGYGVFYRRPDLFIGVNLTWNLFEF